MRRSAPPFAFLPVLSCPPRTRRALGLSLLTDPVTAHPALHSGEAERGDEMTVISQQVFSKQIHRHRSANPQRSSPPSSRGSPALEEGCRMRGLGPRPTASRRSGRYVSESMRQRPPATKHFPLSHFATETTMGKKGSAGRRRGDDAAVCARPSPTAQLSYHNAPPFLHGSRPRDLE
jgi:hypothetical protein